MTTETTCLSSIWKTDETIREFYETHGRSEEYKELNPGAAAYSDGLVYVLSLIHILWFWRQQLWQRFRWELQVLEDRRGYFGSSII